MHQKQTKKKHNRGIEQEKAIRIKQQNKRSDGYQYKTESRRK